MFYISSFYRLKPFIWKSLQQFSSVLVQQVPLVVSSFLALDTFRWLVFEDWRGVVYQPQDHFQLGWLQTPP